MKKSSTPFSIPVSDRTHILASSSGAIAPGYEAATETSPRQTTLNFLRQFARAYRALPAGVLSDAPGLVLN